MKMVGARQNTDQLVANSLFSPAAVSCNIISVSRFQGDSFTISGNLTFIYLKTNLQIDSLDGTLVSDCVTWIYGYFPVFTLWGYIEFNVSYSLSLLLSILVAVIGQVP